MFWRNAPDGNPGIISVNSMFSVAISFVSRIVRYLIRVLFNVNMTPPLSVFETDAGVKYEFGRFDSNHFSRFLIREESFPSVVQSFSELVVNPDLLRNRYALCGTAITETPYFQLMADIDTGVLTPDSDYVRRAGNGTLDHRLPYSYDLDFLHHQYRLRCQELTERGEFTISVIRVSLQNRQRYVILDGKHKAAMAAYLHRPESLRLRFLSNGFSRDTFFRRVYAYTLARDPDEYSINQTMIRAILNES